MGWSHWYSIRSYFRSSLWIVPFIALLLYVVVIRAADRLEGLFDWQLLWPIGLAGTKEMLQFVITLTQIFLVFTFGSLLVAIQVASGQLTPRIIVATLLSDNAIRCTVGLFVFTFLFAMGVLVRLDTTVSPGAAVSRRNARPHLHRGFSLPDRLRGAPAKAGQRRVAGWGGGARSHRERLPRARQGSRCVRTARRTSSLSHIVSLFMRAGPQSSLPSI